MEKKKPNTIKVSIEELDKGGYHVFINVKINGKRCRFLIDTGASKCVVDKAYFEKHLGKLKVVKQSTTGLHSSTVESYFGKIEKFEVGKLAIKNYNVAAVDLAHVNGTYAQIGRSKIHGILGSDVMFKYKMLVDYGASALIIP
jgi:hypothetical protein